MVMTILLCMCSQGQPAEIDRILHQLREYHSKDFTYHYVIKGERILQAESFEDSNDIDPTTRKPRKVPDKDATSYISRDLHLNFPKECLRQMIDDEESVLPKGNKSKTKCLTAHNGEVATYLNLNSKTGLVTKDGITDYSIQKGPGIGYAYFDEAARPILYAHGILCAGNAIPTNGRMVVKMESKHFTIMKSENADGIHSVVLRTVGEKMPHDYWCSSKHDYLPTKIIEYHNITLKKMNEYNINYVKRMGSPTIESWTVETYSLEGMLTQLGHFKVIDQSSVSELNKELFYVKHEPGMSVASREQSKTIKDNSPLNAEFFLANSQNKLVPVTNDNLLFYTIVVILAVLLFAMLLLKYFRRQFCTIAQQR